MTEQLDHLNHFAAGLVQRLSPTARAALARGLGTHLRASTSQRIAAQKNPDGSAYAPRKTPLRAKSGRLKKQSQQRMFRKLVAAKWLKAKSNASTVRIGFTGSAAAIATVHQRGLRDRVNQRGVTAKYAARQLLGLTRADRQVIEEQILTALAR